MSTTKQNFRLIAEVIKTAIPEQMHINGGHNASDHIQGYAQALTDLTGDFADRFEQINPLFNRAKFLTACVIPDK